MEVSYGRVVCKNVDLGPQQVMTPLFQGVDKCKHFFLVYWVVELRFVEIFGTTSHQSGDALLIQL